MSIGMYKEMLKDEDLSQDQLLKVIGYIDSDLDNMEKQKIAFKILKKEVKERLAKQKRSEL